MSGIDIQFNHRSTEVVTLESAQNHMLCKTKPPGSLGALEDWAIKLMLVQQTHTPCVNKTRIVVFAADNGLSSLSQYPRIVTREMLRCVASGGAAISCLTRAHGIDLRIADLGVDLPVDARYAAVDHVRLMDRGANDPSDGREPAMDTAAFSYALGHGREALQQAARDNIDILGVGELGIGNSAVAAVLLSAASGLDAEKVTGAGTGVTGDRFIAKVAAVRAVVDVWRNKRVIPHVNMDPLSLIDFDWSSVIQSIGDLEVVAIASLIHEAATPSSMTRVLIVIDGFITQAALLYALLLFPQDAARSVRTTIIAHASAEHGAAVMLETLRRAAIFRGVPETDANIWVRPVGNWGMRLGEATGAALAIPLLKSAALVAAEMATFEGAGVSIEKTQ